MPLQKRCCAFGHRSILGIGHAGLTQIFRKRIYTAAKKHQIKSYHRLNTVDEMRTCLADGYPFVFGFTVYSTFESGEVAKSRILHLPKRNEQVEGGSCCDGGGI